MKQKFYLFAFLFFLGISNAAASESQTIFEETFSSGIGNFTIYNRVLPSVFTYIWKYDASYGMVASGYMNGTHYESDSWLISPQINLSRCTYAYCEYMHAAKFQNGNTDRGVTVWAAVNPTSDTIILEEWTQLQVPSYPTKGTWTFYSTGQISLQNFAGETNVRIAIRYHSTTAAADTYEMKNFKVTGVIGSTYTITAVPNNQSMGSVVGGGVYIEGTSVQLTATPQEGYNFDQWNDGVKTPTRTITVTSDAAYTAFFTNAETISVSQALSNSFNFSFTNSYGNGSLLTSDPTQNYYCVSGEVSNVVIDTAKLNATYDITDGTGTIKVYNGKALDGAAFRFFGQLQEGDQVTLLTKIQALAWLTQEDLDGSDPVYSVERELVYSHIVYQNNHYVNVGGLVYQINEYNEGTLTNPFNLGTSAIVKDYVFINSNDPQTPVKYIREGALEDASITKLSLPNTIISIGENAFKNCSNLETFISLATTPPDAYESSFEGISNFICTLYVPSASIDAYRNATGWSHFLYVMPVEDILTNMDQTNTSVPYTKFIRDGQILILRGEKIYTLQGVEVK